MKKFLFTLLVLAAGISSMKATEFTIVYDEVINERGPLYQYSKRYLNVTDVVMDDNHTFELVNIAPTSELTAQPDRVMSQAVALENGLVTPYGEEAIMAVSTQKMAENVAKQIYRIREARVNLISCEVERMPADGEAMRLTLAEMNHQEALLTAQFIGSKTVIRHMITVDIDDQADGKRIAFRFSRIQGPVAKDDLSGEPVIIEVKNEYVSVVDPTYQPKKKNEEPKMIDQLVSRNIKLSFNHTVLYETTVDHTAKQ